MAPSGFQKSTIVRLRAPGARALFAASEVLAPGWAAARALGLWFRVPPAPRASDLPPGGLPFEVDSQGHTVRGSSWGEGPVVYLVHGWGGRGSQLAAFVGPLVQAGHRVVMFDAPSHGSSDPGPSGPGRSHAVEFGHALDSVAARFGPARAVIAHSMGAMPTVLAIRDGWLGAERLVFLAPMAQLATHFDDFQRQLGFGRRTRSHLDRATARLVGLDVAEFDVARVAASIEPLPTLIIHDAQDRQTSHRDSVALAAGLADARLVTTTGLGHRRLLHDDGVIGEAVRFVLDKERQREPASAA